MILPFVFVPRSIAEFAVGAKRYSLSLSPALLPASNRRENDYALGLPVTNGACVVFPLNFGIRHPILSDIQPSCWMKRSVNMANWSDPRTIGAEPGIDVGARGAAFDAGLRSYMLSVYNYMASGVLLTGLVSYFFAKSGMALAIAHGPVMWLVALSPLAFILVMNFGLNKMSTTTLQACFWAFATVMGLSMSVIFLRYTEASIFQAFLATSASFLGLSLFGYTTKKDLSGFGTFLIMGVVGLLVASIANIFLHSSTLSFAISAIGVLVFAGLTAYDTQRIKSMYSYVAGTDMIGKTAIMGALSLYLDFVNMFQFLLSFMGSRD
jgi:uncharacterized protein